MAVVISMLRGVNVGAHHRMKMDALRALYESLELRSPRTYVQSGNVVFNTKEKNLISLAKRIENEIEKVFGFRAPAILRTVAELKSVIAANPVATRPFEPAKLLTMFLASHPDQEVCEKVRKMQNDVEEVWIQGREVYIYYGDGMARPKLSWVAVEKALKITGTGRNWNTVTNLLHLAEQLEA